GLELESLLKQSTGVKPSSVFADRIVGKPYLLIDIDRNALLRYGVSVDKVQKVIQVALGGMPITQTVEGRERYTVRVRYPRELRNTPATIANTYVTVAKGVQVPLSELAAIRYEKGPQSIKSEDTCQPIPQPPGITETKIITIYKKGTLAQISTNRRPSISLLPPRYPMKLPTATAMR
ncbi:MAG: efflux RND transporter permease subunit, partial [Opitutae bacterium]|nr:efflux RND transporter permease subunit [Opitutae bacterium]